jgi:predicted deacylase
MGRTITVGNVSGKRGHYVYGTVATLPLPSGGVESWPVIIAQGDEGPVLWLTANIHGGEVTGVAAIQDILTPDLPRRLRGTIVVIPTLNPAGLRMNERRAYYDDHDPNRLFPLRKEPGEHDDDDAFPSPYGIVAQHIATAIRATADFLIDLHCAWTLSVPFTIRDRVLYRDERERPQAEKLHHTLDAMVHAFGLAVVNEYPARKYVKQELHRSVAGFALNDLHLPAFTVELGATGVVEPHALQAGRQGIENVLMWAGMLAGTPRPITCVPTPDLGYSVCREEHPRAPTSGLITYRVNAGDVVREGDVIATLRDVYARPLAEGVVRTDKAGWVIGLCAGMAVYPNTYLAELAVRDSEPLIARYPG